MGKRLLSIFCVILALSFIVILESKAAEAQSCGAKAKNFWQRLFNYPANVTQESANIVADAGKGGVKAVTDEVKTVGQVTSGEICKTPDLVTKPLTTAGETTCKAVQDTANMPCEAAKASEPVAEPCPAPCAAPAKAATTETK
jgi:hypothetical protein